MLHYDPQHVSSITLLILRKTDCITTASGIVTLCKQPYSMQVESGLQFALNLHTVRLLSIKRTGNSVIIVQCLFQDYNIKNSILINKVTKNRIQIFVFHNFCHSFD